VSGIWHKSNDFIFKTGLSLWTGLKHIAMKINFLLTAITITAITSCSTSYRTGQTPDDVYYSPVRYQSDEVRRDREENNTNDNTVYTSSDDRELRRRVRNRRYRRYDDRYDYPYGYNGVYGNPKINTTQNNSTPRKTNLGGYTPNSAKADSSGPSNPKMAMQQKQDGNSNGTNPVRTFNNSNSNKGSAVGNMIRRIFTPDNSSNGSSNSSSNSNSSTRTFERSSNTNNNSNSSNNSGSSSSSKTSSSSSSAPVRTFGKQN
jgi:hypothetical protein